MYKSRRTKVIVNGVSNTVLRDCVSILKITLNRRKNSFWKLTVHDFSLTLLVLSTWKENKTLKLLLLKTNSWLNMIIQQVCTHYLLENHDYLFSTYNGANRTLLNLLNLHISIWCHYITFVAKYLTLFIGLITFNTHL